MSLDLWGGTFTLFTHVCGDCKVLRGKRPHFSSHPGLEQHSLGPLNDTPNTPFNNSIALRHVRRAGSQWPSLFSGRCNERLTSVASEHVDAALCWGETIERFEGPFLASSSRCIDSSVLGTQIEEHQCMFGSCPIDRSPFSRDQPISGNFIHKFCFCHHSRVDISFSAWQPAFRTGMPGNSPRP